MDFGRKVIVAVNLEETTKEQLAMLRSLEFLKKAEVHCVHVYHTTNMGYGLGEFSLALPVEPDRQALEKSLTETLKESCRDCFSGEKVTYKCLFDADPKEEFCLYAKEVKADTIVVFSRAKHGIFESSFAQYVVRHTNCHTVILKDQG